VTDPQRGLVLKAADGQIVLTASLEEMNDRFGGAIERAMTSPEMTV